MNRRGFLSLLVPAAALLAAPELLVPKRTFFLPPVGGWAIGDAQRMREAMLRMAEIAINPPLIIVDQKIWASDLLKVVEQTKPGAVLYTSSWSTESLFLPKGMT